MPANRPGSDQSPFASTSSTQRTSPKISLWMLFVSMMVFAGVSLLLATAVRIPSVANGFRELFGIPTLKASQDNQRSTHLFLLLFCYSSPLLMMIWVSFLRRLILIQQRRLDQRLQRELAEDSEFNMES